MAWDPEFGRGRFAIGYEDRVLGRETVVPLAAVDFDRGRPGTFTVQRDGGSAVAIPLHRVRTVYKDGDVIWRRPAGAPRGRRAHVQPRRNPSG